MKVEELKRKERPIEDIYKEIQLASDRGDYRYMLPTFQYVSHSTIAMLLNDGFKCYQMKDFCGLINWIIEW